jgi:hypothetical protein
LLFLFLAEVLPHLPENSVFIQRAADKRVNPIKLFCWKLGERNAQVIGYGTFGPATALG